jgi:hypothetical protein
MSDTFFKAGDRVVTAVAVLFDPPTGKHENHITIPAGTPGTVQADLTGNLDGFGVLLPWAAEVDWLDHT